MTKARTEQQQENDAIKAEAKYNAKVKREEAKADKKAERDAKREAKALAKAEAKAAALALKAEVATTTKTNGNGKAKNNDCLCGCGAKVRAYFAQGHDQRMRGFMLRVVAETASKDEAVAVKQAQATGWVLDPTNHVKHANHPVLSEQA